MAHNVYRLQRIDRPASVPPSTIPRNPEPEMRPSSTSADLAPGPAASRTLDADDPIGSKALDTTPILIRSVATVVKTRNGSVLSRGTILKSDHYPSGRALQLDINLQGAPNFRSPRQGTLNVFGVAQPRLQGLKAILSILGCRPDAKIPLRCIWFSTREEPIVYISGRPFVLRDGTEPRTNMALSDRAENIEDIEQRLKLDILSEASRFGGLILTHIEIAEGEGAIIPTWTEVDFDSVKTSKEMWASLNEGGWRVQYHRIPISPERPIEDNYLDAYLRVLLDRSADPSVSSLLFSCGMGVVRTTFAMCASSIIRRRQLVLKGLPDPYDVASFVSATQPGRHMHTGSSLLGLGQSSDGNGSSTPPGVQAAVALGQVGAQQEFSRSLLRLTYILQQCLQSETSNSAIELLLTQPSLMENLRKAHAGNYAIILSLLGCVDNGLMVKHLVDKVIDSCDHVVNLREDILLNRIRYSLTTMADKKRDVYLEKAAKALEKYFFLVAFASYVEEQTDFKGESFGDWMKARAEIWNQVTFLRKRRGSRLNVFAPVNDLSSLAKAGSEGNTLEAGPRNDIAISGGQILGDEWTTHVVENRGGIVLRANTLLKSDQWIKESDPTDDGVRGAINFRNVPDTKIYALGQPSLDAIDEVISRVKNAHPSAKKIVWITLREEPIVYVNGVPFCLRRENFSLRNMKDYSGVSAHRLETLEDRLKSDVISELNAFGGRLLLHTETADGVIPIWETVQPGNVSVVKEVMASRKFVQDIELKHRRIPITSELPPDFSDIAEFLDVIIRTGKETPIVVNCQLGRGRSTMTSIIMTLIQRWLGEGFSRPHTPRTPVTKMLPLPLTTLNLEVKQDPPPTYHSYKVINNALRVVRRGLEVKATVDSAIDQCAQFFNLRDSIEDARAGAEEATDDGQRRRHVDRGTHNLRRYFQLVIFQAYLNATPPDTLRDMETFERFVKNRPVFHTFEQEIFTDGIQALKPLERMEVSEGLALSDEVKQVVANRSGNILSASTILKSDFFSNLQKMSLPERIDGAPNFRRVPLTLHVPRNGSTSYIPNERDENHLGDLVVQDQKQACGSGMPTVQGLKLALSRVDAGRNGRNRVAWTSLREEPVLYVAGRPHVLRLIERPLENVEATGITREVVEQIEQSFKEDVLREVRDNNGKILLHDELETEPGSFDIIPQWEKVNKEDILTPRDVFDLVAREGYNVDYARIPITDEQAPLPSALAQLLERVKTSLHEAGDLIFNCQMGRGRTTTGMVAACLISTILSYDSTWDPSSLDDNDSDSSGLLEGPSPEEAYLQGEYKLILQLVGVLSFGKAAKRVTDMAIDLMQDVQNLRKAIFDYKVKVDATTLGSVKHTKLKNVAVNYLYRYGTLIVFANYLIEVREQQTDPETVVFPEWLNEHREIAKLLARRSLD